VAVPKRYALCADELWDGLGGDPVSEAAVIVNDGKIVAAGSRKALAAELRDLETLEYGGCTILPGLIDTHVHLALRPELTADESIAFAQSATTTEALAVMEENASRALASGLTTVRDCGSPGASGVALRDIAERTSTRLPRVLVSGRPITTPTGHCHWMGKVAESTEQVVRAVNELTTEGVDFIKVMATGGMMTAGSDPSRAQYSEEVLRALVSAARSRGRRVAAHALSAPGVRVALAARVDTIEHCVTTTPARQDYDPALAPAIAAAGIVVGVTAHHPLRTLLSADDVEGIRTRLAPHRHLRESGVSLVVHSDAGTPGTAFEHFAESVEIFQLGLDTTVGEAVAAATSVSAAALGMKHRTGALRRGLTADLLIVRGILSTDVRALRRPVCVMRSGTIAQTPPLIPLRTEESK
jgi:imidazolonepropionase-like amidohydrolase